MMAGLRNSHRTDMHACTFWWSLPSECWMRRSNSLICRCRRWQSCSEPYRLARVLGTASSVRFPSEFLALWSIGVLPDIITVPLFCVFADISRRAVTSSHVWIASSHYWFNQDSNSFPRQQKRSMNQPSAQMMARMEMWGRYRVGLSISGRWSRHMQLLAPSTHSTHLLFFCFFVFFTRDSMTIWHHKQWQRGEAQNWEQKKPY